MRKATIKNTPSPISPQYNLRAYKVALKYQLIFRYHHLLNGLKVKYKTHCTVFTTKPVVKNVMAKHTCTSLERFSDDRSIFSTLALFFHAGTSRIVSVLTAQRLLTHYTVAAFLPLHHVYIREM